jgi:hypothetical protein
MDLHPSWQAIRDAEDLVPVPLDSQGQPIGTLDLPAEGGEERWLVIAPGSARLHPDFGSVLRAKAALRRDVGIYYADEVESATGGASRLQLKPALNLALLLANDYIGSPVIVLQAAFERLNGFRPDAGPAQVYDLVLRAVRAGIGVDRIPVVMVAHPQGRPRIPLGARREAVEHWIGNSGHIFEVVQGRTVESLQLRRHFDTHPEVTLVVPTRQSCQTHVSDATYGKPHITNLLDSLAATDWPMDRLQVLIGDDIEDDAIYRGRRDPFGTRRILTPRAEQVPFNYAAKMNRLWREAQTEYVVLMNDDIVVRQGGWLRAMMTFAMNEDVGGVGARLLYGDGTIQHAGMPGGLFGATAHAWMQQPATAPTYGDWAVVHREWSMVTGALFATRLSVLEALNGFDERFTLEFNDVDLCLRMKLLGYRIVFTPFAELLHYEKASRGTTLPRGDEVALFLKRWTELLDNDPAFNPGFDLESTFITPKQPADPWYRK